MAYHEKINTSIKDIIEYYRNNLQEEDISSDFTELHKRCWHCGDVSKLYRCHIIPSSAGGIDEPSNYVLLCRRCHEEAPNCKDKKIMLSWLKFTGAKIYGTYWGKEINSLYNTLYDTNFIKEYNSRDNKNPNGLKKIIFSKFNDIKIHIGSGNINLSTWVGIFKMAFDEFDSIYK